MVSLRCYEPHSLAHRLDGLDRGRPEIPVGCEQVLQRILAARPGVPELLRIERAMRGACGIVERDAEMPVNNVLQALFDPNIHLDLPDSACVLKIPRVFRCILTHNPAP